MTSINFFLIFVPILSAILIALNFIFAPHIPYKEKKTPFECGYHSFLLQNRTQFTISFFIFGLLFLLFDLEIILIYPFTVSSMANMVYGLVIMLLFTIIITVGFVYELGKDALKIESRQYNVKSLTPKNSSTNEIIKIILSMLFDNKEISDVKLYFMKDLLENLSNYAESKEISNYIMQVIGTVSLLILSNDTTALSEGSLPVIDSKSLSPFEYISYDILENNSNILGYNNILDNILENKSNLSHSNSSYYPSLLLNNKYMTYMQMLPPVYNDVIVFSFRYARTEDIPTLEVLSYMTQIRETPGLLLNEMETIENRIQSLHNSNYTLTDLEEINRNIGTLQNRMASLLSLIENTTSSLESAWARSIISEPQYNFIGNIVTRSTAAHDELEHRNSEAKITINQIINNLSDKDLE